MSMLPQENCGQLPPCLATLPTGAKGNLKNAFCESTRRDGEVFEQES